MQVAALVIVTVPDGADAGETLDKIETATEGMRWGVFVRDPRDGPEWSERHRWTDGELDKLGDQAAADTRAAEYRRIHPEWEVTVRQTADPLPGTFRETFAALLPDRED